MTVGYTAVVEQGPTSWGAYVPDLPGCVDVGSGRQEVEALIRGAVAMHVEGMRADGEPIPAPGTWTTVVDIDVAGVGAASAGADATPPPR